MQLVENGQELLESEQETLVHAEEIKAELTNATMLLDEENSVLPLLNACK